MDDVQFTDIPRETPPFATAKKLFEHSNIDDSAVEFVPADATNLQYKSETFDAVFALDVLEHIPNEEAAIREMQRVTKSDGLAVVSAPIEVGIPELIREMYRFLDGDRRQTGSIMELLQNAVGSPRVSDPGEHRGYDYRETVQLLSRAFRETLVRYCPLPAVKWLNPTAIITATGAD
ncbi:class I SAM-dependent methyltransferase [Halobacterium salinarum]|uniref:class I SAM-dependent methyltransferase n=1 Tax=Halobacterium salinarum TaxID=2242 RepID=UPI003904BF18